MSTCVYKNCGNSRYVSKKQGNDVHFFRFPKEEQMRLAWIQNSGLNLAADLKNHHRLCSDHFIESDYGRVGGRRELRVNALPKQVTDTDASLVLTLPKTVHTAKIQLEGEILLIKFSTALKAVEIGDVLQKVYVPKRISPPRRVLQTSMPSSSSTIKLRQEFRKSRVPRKHEKISKDSKTGNATLIANLEKQIKSWKKKYFSKCKPDNKVKKDNNSKTTEQVKKILSKLFTDSQMKLILNPKMTKTHWKENDISKALCLRTKSPAAYDLVRETWKIPLPSPATLKRWVTKIFFTPGVLKPVLQMLQCEFSAADQLPRQCAISFDEMSLDGSIAYDPALDQVFGPNKNAMVVFARGLFSKWKQPIYYGYDEKLTVASVGTIIEEVHDAGLNVVSFTCDCAPCNRATWNQLGVTYKKPHFKNQVTGNPVYCFPDPPHLIKLLRNNLFDHGFRLQDGTVIVKQDFIRLLQADHGEHKICHKLTSRHLDVVGAERMRVRLACETISRTVAAAIDKYFPEKSRVAKFIRLANDFFDIVNSRIKNDPNPLKCSFGLHLTEQIRVLDEFYQEVETMRCLRATTMFPFQRGILQCITALKLMFKDLQASPLKIRYLNVNRINQDIAENAFSILRSIGGFNQTPNPVDFKYRLRYLCLMWHLLIVRSTCPVLNSDYLPADEEIVVSMKISPLMIGLEVQPGKISEETEQQIASLSLKTDITSENWTTFNENLRLSEQCEFGGQEYVSGYIAKKLKNKYRNLVLDNAEETRTPLSWVQQISKGGLHIPSYDFMNLCIFMNQYFLAFHKIEGSKWQINKIRGVTSTLSTRIIADCPSSMDIDIIQSYVRTRTFIRIAYLNDKIQQAKHKKRNAMKRKQFGRAQEPNLSESDSELSD